MSRAHIWVQLGHNHRLLHTRVNASCMSCSFQPLNASRSPYGSHNVPSSVTPPMVERTTSPRQHCLVRTLSMKPNVEASTMYTLFGCVFLMAGGGRMKVSEEHSVLSTFSDLQCLRRVGTSSCRLQPSNPTDSSLHNSRERN